MEGVELLIKIWDLFFFEKIPTVISIYAKVFCDLWALLREFLYQVSNPYISKVTGMTCALCTPSTWNIKLFFKLYTVAL